MADNPPAKKKKASHAETIRRLREKNEKLSAWNGKKNTNSTKRVCRACKWWLGGMMADANEKAECRRYPPTNGPVVTKALYGCGEYARNGLWGFVTDDNNE